MIKIEAIKEESVACRILCKSIYHGQRDDGFGIMMNQTEWHQGVDLPAKIIRKMVRVGEFEVPMTIVELEGKHYGVCGVRPGLEGRVIALEVNMDYYTTVLYTDILTEDGRSNPDGFGKSLRGYARGDYNRG